jgi:tetratricopeptide (TPR) repeat protein
MALSNSLGGLPLALDLAGRYLRSMTDDPFPAPDVVNSFNAYKDTFEQHTMELRMNDNDADGTENGPDAPSTTWDISLALLQRQGHDLARPLLRLLACFAPAPVPYRAVLDPAILADSVLFTQPTPQRLGAALRALSGLGLIVLDVDRGAARPATAGQLPDQWLQTLSMHPLVRTVTRGRVRASGELNAYLRILARLLGSITGGLDTGNADDWARWAAIAPHCLAPLDLIADPETVEPDAASAALLPARHGAWYRYMAGMYEQTTADHQTMLAISGQVLGDTHLDTLSIRNSLARAIRETGRNEAAEAEFRAVLSTARNVLGEEHPTTINIRVNLARTIRESGRSSLAEVEFRSIVELANRVLGEEDSDTLAAALNLAVTLREQARYTEAEAEYRAVLSGWRRHHPEEDLTTLDIRYELAETMRQSGLLDAAQAEYEGILTIARQVYGEQHPNTLIIRHGLASALRDSGRIDAARAELSEILELRQTYLGVDHPFSTATAAELDSLLE